MLDRKMNHMNQAKSVPWDIILCLCSSTLFLIIFLFIGGTFQIIFGIPFIIFIPGYLFIFSLFPSSRTDKKIKMFERLMLSIVFSLALVSLVGLGLNFTSLKITAESFCYGLYILIFCLSLIAVIRWYLQPPMERYQFRIRKKMMQSKNKIDIVLNIVIVITICATMIAIVVLTVTSFSHISERGESFTEFYILGSDNMANAYPKNISSSENHAITVGLTNYEQKKMNYTIEVWLINQSIHKMGENNSTSNQYHEMIFLNKTTIILPAYTLNIENVSDSQWEYLYQFNISNKTGIYKLQFLLFLQSTENFDYNANYKTIAQDRIDNAYRKVHLWVNIQEIL